MLPCKVLTNGFTSKMTSSPNKYVGYYTQLEGDWWCSDDPECLDKWGPFPSEEEARQELMERIVNERFAAGDDTGEFKPHS